MIISLCIPAMNRTRDLCVALPHMIRAANASPPVEIAVLDYNSSDMLCEYIEAAGRMAQLAEGNMLNCRRYEGREHYHMAHAYNLAVMASVGEYVVVMGADAMPAVGYVEALRGLIAEGCVWMRGRHLKGIVCVQRAEFIAAGGYDERFEFYSGEDKELEARLKRRGGTFGLVPDGLMRVLRTPAAEKTRNFRLPLTKLQMMERGALIRAGNALAGLLVANEGKEWGAW